MNPNRIVPLLIAAVLNVATLLGQQKLSREEYIRRYKGLAVEEMDIYGIPASIKHRRFSSGERQRPPAREA